MTETLKMRNGLDIPKVGFGTYLVSPLDAPKAIQSAIELGYRHIDTAMAYQNEAEVGRGIEAGMKAAGVSREDIFITAKLWPGNPDWGMAVMDYRNTMDCLHRSLSALDTSYVDLYLIHAPFGGPERLNQWRALLDAKSEGLVRSVGVSNYNLDHIAEIENAGLELPEANQLELHPWEQKKDLVVALKNKGILPIAYSSLLPLSNWRAEPGQESGKTEDLRVENSRDNALFQSMARKYGVSEAQILLRWGVQNGYPVLPKSLKKERAAANLDLFGFSIDAEDMDTLSELDRGQGLAWAQGDPMQLA